MCAYKKSSGGYQVEDNTGSQEKGGFMLVLDSGFISFWAYEPFPLFSGDNINCLYFFDILKSLQCTNIKY